MPIHVIWDDDEKKIIKHIYDGKWSLGEFHQAVDQNAMMVSSVPHQVDIIADLSKSAGIPSNMLSTVNRVLKKMPANQRLNVIVGADRFTTILLNVALKIVPNGSTSVKIVPTLEEAYEIIKSVSTGKLTSLD